MDPETDTSEVTIRHMGDNSAKRRGQWIESTQSSATSVSSRRARTKSLNKWTNEEVLSWLSKHTGYYIAYSNLFREHEITGKTIMRLKDDTLKRMGMENQLHRTDLLKKITILKLKGDLVDLKNEMP